MNKSAKIMINVHMNLHIPGLLSAQLNCFGANVCIPLS